MRPLRLPPPRRRRHGPMRTSAVALVLLLMLTSATAPNAQAHGENAEDAAVEEDLVEDNDEFVDPEERREEDGEDDERDMGEEEEEILWDEDDLDDGEELHINATADELEALSGIADFLGNLQQLLGEADHQKERERAERILTDAWGPVQRMADATATQAAFAAEVGTAQCVVGESKRAREAVNTLRAGIDDCYDKALTQWVVEAGASKSLQLQAEDEDADEAAEVEVEAGRFLSLGLAILRASPFIDAADALDALAGGIHAPSLSSHAEMLVRRGRRRRARLTACVDLQLELAYKRADNARDAIAGCVVLGVFGQSKEVHDEL